VTASLLSWVIPHALNDPTPEASPEKAATVSQVLVAIHLVLLALLIWEIRVSRRGGRLPKAGLIIPGIILILMSMLLIDAARTFLEHQPDLFSMVIVLFINALCDLIAGIITIMLPTRLLFQKQSMN